MAKYVSNDNLARYTVKMKKNIADRVKEVTDKEGAANGVATLGADGKLTAAQLPALKSVNGVSVVGSGNISIDLSLYKYVDKLPTTDIDATKIYVTPISGRESGKKNDFEEYIYIKKHEIWSWEKLGDVVVDASLNPQSTNPVQNRVVVDHVETVRQNLIKIFKGDVEGITAGIPLGIVPSAGTAWAMVPFPEMTNTERGGKEYSFTAALFATKEGLDSCVKKTDLVTITNEEIDAMF